VYTLKKTLGLPAYVYHPVKNDHNIETGVISREYQILYIAKTVMTPENWMRNFNYDLSYIASGKNFVYGGYYDVSRRDFIIDADDLPDDFIPSNNDFLLFDEKRYEILTAEMSERLASWIINAKHVASYDPIVFKFFVSESVAHTVNLRICGNYFENGIHNSHTLYTKFDGRYYLWYSNDSSKWVVSVLKGVKGTSYWERKSESITGEYLPIGGAEGAVVITGI
jgi:hypothetical protein